MLIIKKPKWYTIIIHFHFVKSLLLCVCIYAIYHRRCVCLNVFFVLIFFYYQNSCTRLLAHTVPNVYITIKTEYKNESLNGQYCIFICCSCKAAHKIQNWIEWQTREIKARMNARTHAQRRTMGHGENVSQPNNVSNGLFFFFLFHENKFKN